MKKLFSSQQGYSPSNTREQETHAVFTPKPIQKSLRRAFASLQQRNYRLFYFGQLISLAGTAMQIAGQAWLVLELTRSAWQLGLVGALQALPILCFALVSGIFVDRWPRRRVLLITQIAAMIQALFLWVLIVSNLIQIWQVYVLAAALGITNSLYLPTNRAFLVEMVGRENLSNAVALNSLLSTLARIVGPGIAGLIIAASSVTVLFLLNALSFLPVIAALVLIKKSALHIQPGQERNTSQQSSTWQSLSEGVAYVWKTPAALLIILVAGLVLLFGSNFNVVLPLFATSVLRVGAKGFGFLSAALGVGALFSAFWLAWSEQKPAIRYVVLGMFLFSILEAIFALTRFYPLSLVLMAGVGFTENTFAARSLATLQIITPDHLRGRVTSVQVLFFDGSLPLGYVFMGWLCGLAGPSNALLIGALFSLLVLGATWFWRGLTARENRTDTGLLT